MAVLGPPATDLMNALVIFDLFLLLFLGLADNQTVPALLPLLVKSFRISIESASLLAVFYSAAAATASFLTGSLSDHFGRKRFLVGGAAAFAVASWVASRSGSFLELTLARALTGLAAGTISTCSIAFAGDYFAYNIRGKAIGIISIAYFAAPILGVPLAAEVASRSDWQGAFVFFAILAALVSGASLALPGEKRISQATGQRLRTTLRTCRGFFGRRDTTAMLVIAFLVSGGLYGFIFYIGQWMSTAFGVNTKTIGLVFMLGGLVAVGSAPLGGILSDRWGKRGVSIASNILLAVSVLAVPFFHWGVLLLVVFGATSLGAAFRQGPLTALMTELVPAAQRGAFVAMRNVSSQFGIAAATLAGGMLYARHGYLAVTTLCGVMTALVAILLTTHIVEPRPEVEGAE
jgi:predicted MFS family arabinose efflux permease